MPIPDFQTLMGPLLSVAIDGADHSFRESQDILAKQFDVTDEDRRILLPSGRAQLFTNRVGWAKTHLKMAGLIENRARGIFRITPRGTEVLRKTKGKIDLRTLQAEPGYIIARSGQPEDVGTVKTESKASEISRTPSEMIEAAYQEVRKNTAVDLLQRIKGASPEFFERLVVELLVKMGYGGTIKDAGRAIGRTGDEGIDGIIKEDRLGLDTIYIQAKRWEQTIGRPEIQKFAGALQGMRAKKGVFITTSDFSSEARSFVEKIDLKIVLLGGSEVSELMIDYDLGVARLASYEVKRVDEDYFSEE
jgi:restriction system protein